MAELYFLAHRSDKGNFAEWYSAYPRRVARAEAEKAYMQALRKGYFAPDILQGAIYFSEMCRRKGTERDFIPHPATWLRGERWADEELLEFAPASKEEAESSKDRADRYFKRGKYAEHK